MDKSVYLAMSGIALVFGRLLGLACYFMLKTYRNNTFMLKRKDEMGGLAQGRITGLERVRRRNRSFRWTNEIPTISYTVNGVNYSIQLKAAEARAGTYRIGTPCTVRYIMSEPQVCLPEEFEKKIKTARTNALIAALLLGFFAANCVSGRVANLINALIGK